MISLSLEEFGTILNLPHEDIVLWSGDKGYNFNLKFVPSSLMNNSSPNIPNTFTIEYILPNSRIIHYMTNHILFPRKSNFGLLIQFDVEVVWIIENKIKVNGVNK